VVSGKGVGSNTGIMGVSKEIGEMAAGGSGLEATLPLFLSLSSRHPINRTSTIIATTEGLVTFLISPHLLSVVLFEKVLLNGLYYRMLAAS
jgi:hypothetical protein